MSEDVEEFLDELEGKRKKNIKRSLNKIREYIKPAVIILIVLTALIPSIYVGIAQSEADKTKILAYSSGNFIVWNEDAATRVSPYFKPALLGNGINPSIEVSAAGREFESTQIIFYKMGSRNITDINVKLSPFVDSVGNKIIPVENQSIGMVDPIRTEFFDRIEPLEYSQFKFNLSEERNYPLWYTVYVPADTPAGTYNSIITFTIPEMETIEIAVSLRVYGFNLPINHTYQSMVNPMTDNKNLMQNFFDHRVDFGGVPLEIDFDKETLKWTFNWSKWDNLTQYALDHGQNQFKLPSPRGYISEFERYSQKYNFSVLTFYSELGQHLRQKGWIKHAYVYDIDEPSVQVCRENEPYWELVHQADPELRILLTTAPREEISFLYDDIDIWAPIEHDLDKHLDTLKQLQKQGKEIVYYPCLFPKTPYANIMIYNQLIDTKVLAWQVFYYDIDGFLYWHIAAYYYNRHGYGYNSWLDGWLIYPRNASEGIYDSSLRWEVLRDGFEDIEYFYILKQLTQTNPLYSEQIDEFLSGMKGIMRDFRTFSDNPDDYISYRNRAATLIEEVLSHP